MLVERWDIFEITLQGPKEGNPFVEQWVKGVSRGKNETSGSFSQAKTSGSFTVVPATGNNYGPVRVANGHHFAW